MNTVIFNCGGFYEFEEMKEFFNEFKTIHENVVGFLNNNDMLSFNQIKNTENYIITIIKEENGEHKAFYVNGLELKINYKNYEKMAHGEINIWKSSSLDEYGRNIK